MIKNLPLKVFKDKFFTLCQTYKDYISFYCDNEEDWDRLNKIYKDAVKAFNSLKEDVEKNV